MSEAAELFRQGLEHHRAGNLAQAEALYRRVLAIQPGHAKTLHLLGLVAHQAARHDVAAELIREAIRRCGNNPNFLSDLGAVLKQQGKLDEAVIALGRAIEIKPEFAEALCNLGAALRDQGKLDEALAPCRQAIRIRPDYSEAHANLGVLLFDRGALSEAVAALSESIRIDPANTGAYFNLGHAFRAQNKPDEAVSAYRSAIRIRPDFAEAYSSLGALLCEQGKIGEAIAVCRQAIRIRPDYAEAHSNLGVALYAQGNLDEAAAEHRRAIAIAPADAEAHAHLGVILSAQGKFDEAVAAHREAVRLKPNSAECHSHLGRALHDHGKIDDAIVALRQAIALKPDFANAYNNLGLALRALGRLAEGRAALQEAVRLVPANASYQRNLSEIARFVSGDSRLADMERLAAGSAALSVDDRIELHFALGKAYEDLGRHAEAFQQWLDGNALKRGKIAYDEVATLKSLDRTREIFTRELFQNRSNVGHPSRVPIFIVGMMRAGTTLVEQILASHPQIFGAGELPYFARAMKGIRISSAGATIFPEPVPAMADADLRNLGARYLAHIEPLARSAARVTDKLPGNFLFVGLIHLVLPYATIIHVVRDPIDTCLSCFSKLFTAEQNHTYDLAELGRFYCHYQKLMTHWHSVLPAGRILEVRYENVVADLENEARRLVAHCGLKWDPQCLSFHETERPVRTASATQVRQPIYDRSIGRWRVHETFLRPLIAELEKTESVT